MARILIGVAWPYANGPQHIGQLAGNALPADLFARYHRSAGHEVVMVSGSDMHGTPTTVKAEAEGVDPGVIAERFHQVHAEVFRRLGISFDLYTNTHTDLHARTAQGVFLTLLQEGYVEKRTAPAAYCPKHQRFRPDRYVTGICPHCGSPSARGDECDSCARVLEPQELKEPRCLLCGTPVEFRLSEHFYFLLPKLTDRLKAYHDSVRDHWRPPVRSFTENYLREGLKPRPITRDIPWGVPLPLDGYPDKRLYVWFEAVIGYLSATKEWAARQGSPDAWKRFWQAGEDVRIYQFLGKDNITFHTIFWPAILLGVGGLQLPYDVPANEWVVFEGGKMSKSRSSGEASIFLPDLLERFSPDTIRFYGSYHMPENHDTEFHYDDIAQDHDQILADQWGNLVHRVLTFVTSRYEGKVPSPPAGWTEEKSAAAQRIGKAHREATEHFEAVRLKEALETVLELVREGNRSFHESRPWSQQGAERDTAVFEALWTLRAATVMLSPFLPFSSERVAKMLGTPALTGPGGWSLAASPPTPGTALGPVSPLFSKLLTVASPGGNGPATGGSSDGVKPPVLPAKGPKGPAETPPAARSPSMPPTVVPAASPPSGPPPLLDIRAGRIVTVLDHPKADKLYVLTIEAGEEKPRTLVAGIKPFYRPEELQGQTVALLCNLEPRALRGVTSQGMILAAESGSTISVLTAPPGTPPGTRLQGLPTQVPMIRYEDFSRARLVVAKAVLPTEAEATGYLDAGEGIRAAVVPSGSPSLLIARLDPPDGKLPAPLLLASGGCYVPGRELPPGAKVR